MDNVCPVCAALMPKSLRMAVSAGLYSVSRICGVMMAVTSSGKDKRCMMQGLPKC